MRQLTDTSYSNLKENKRAYEILLLREQYDNTFAYIAKEYEISVTRVVQIYHKLKRKQILLYINHITVALGYESSSQVRKVFNVANECYQDWVYACAYLEKKYTDILTEYRAGEPGMPMQFIKNIPPLKPHLSKKMIARVIEMRETEKASFVTIAKELRMTQAKAKHTYQWVYHKQVLALIKVLQEKAESDEEKEAIWKYCFSKNKSSKKCYEMLIKKYYMPQTGE